MQKNRTQSKNTLPLILILWPPSAVILGFLIGTMTNASSNDSGDLFGDTSFIQSIFDILSIALWGGAFLLGPISFVIGLVLLFKRRGN